MSKYSLRCSFDYAEGVLSGSPRRRSKQRPTPGAVLVPCMVTTTKKLLPSAYFSPYMASYPICNATSRPCQILQTYIFPPLTFQWQTKRPTRKVTYRSWTESAFLYKCFEWTDWLEIFAGYIAFFYELENTSTGGGTPPSPSQGGTEPQSEGGGGGVMVATHALQVYSLDWTLTPFCFALECH